MLHSHGRDFTNIEGNGANGVMVVAEASGEHEAYDRLPLRPYAPAGGVFERCLQRMNLPRDAFSITNVLRCRPRNNWLEKSPWEFSAIAHCRPNLTSAIAERRPRAIVSLGNIATRELTAMSGHAMGINHLAGYVLPHYVQNSPTVIPVIPNFHPSYLRQGKASYQGVYSRHFMRAMQVASGLDRKYLWGVRPSDRTTWGPKNYEVGPGFEDFHAFRMRVEADPNRFIAKDIETPESLSLDEDAREGFVDTHVRQIQFTNCANYSIAVPFAPPYIADIMFLLNAPNPFYGHNWDNFDHKVLRAHCEREGLHYAPKARCFDTLDMFHHWQPDLPAHLQFAASFIRFEFPWKHLHALVEDEPFYGCCDTDATWQLGEFLRMALVKEDVWGDPIRGTGYIGQTNDLRPVLAAMEDRGLPVDDERRLALAGTLDIAMVEMGKEIAAMAPGLGRVHPKEGYKGVPPEIKKWCNDLGLFGMGTPPAAEDFVDPQGDHYHYEMRPFEEAVERDGKIAIAVVTRWCRVYDFNPNSGDQLKNYMRSKGHAIPRSRETDEEGNQKETTAKKELVRLATKHGDLLYLRAIEYREMSKAKGTYVDGFVPAADGCVHTTFTTQTGIGQLASRNPNTQNIPKHGHTESQRKVIRALRGMFRAQPGKVITELDYKSCHVITLGFLARDPNYTRLGRLDIHSFVAGHYLNLWDGFKIFQESDDELLARFKWLKSDPDRKLVRDDQAKHGILGIGNGLQAKGLFERYVDSFPPRRCPHCSGGRVAGVRQGTTRKCDRCNGSGWQRGIEIAQEILEICEALFKPVFAYQKATRQEAHEKRILRTSFGHIRRFYEVFRYDGRRAQWIPGDQYNEAAAFPLANIAHAHMRETMKEIDRAGFARKYGMCNQVHDALYFHHDEDQLDDLIRDIYPLMRAPSKILIDPISAPNGLWIDVEASTGPDLHERRDIDLKGARAEYLAAHPEAAI